MNLLSIPEPPASAYFIVEADNGVSCAIMAKNADAAIAEANENLRVCGVKHYRAVRARQATDADFDAL